MKGTPGPWPGRFVLLHCAYVLNTEEKVVTPEERAICTAPLGKFLIIHVDPRDHFPAREGEPKGSLDEVRATLDTMIAPQREVMEVYNDQGELVLL